MKRFLSLVLCCAALCSVLSGCNNPHNLAGDGLTWDDDPGGSGSPENTEQSLTLTYYPERSLNPFLSTDFTNRALFPLLYQSLFSVDRNYRVEPQLCKQYSVSSDLRTYTFYIEENVKYFIEFLKSTLEI